MGFQLFILTVGRKDDILCQLVSKSPVATVVRHHELLQLVQIFSPLVCVQQLQQQQDEHRADQLES